jgi:hypothetical protein
LFFFKAKLLGFLLFLLFCANMHARAQTRQHEGGTCILHASRQEHNRLYRAFPLRWRTYTLGTCMLRLVPLTFLLYQFSLLLFVDCFPVVFGNNAVNCENKKEKSYWN